MIDKLIESFSLNALENFIQSKNPSFKSNAEDYNSFFEGNVDVQDSFTDIQKLGEAEVENFGSLAVITAEAKTSLTERSGKKIQFEIAKKILKYAGADAAIFVFYDAEGNFRFSYINTNFEGNKRTYTSFKRYTYYVSIAQTNQTFKAQIDKANFNNIDSILEAFSVEPLNKEFYKNIQTAFYNLVGGTLGKNKVFTSSLKLPSLEADKNKKIYQEFAVRLIGRTIFVWFLKNKVSESGKPLIPTYWLSSDNVTKNPNFYHEYMEPLFFEVLNKWQDDRVPNLPEGSEDIPFLNGGLFEAETDDFYKPNRDGKNKTPNLIVPDEWIENLFKTLEQFNFTIDENTLNDKEVSIDPEMLGTIFENLLAEIDPDTEKSARNSTGSFYTPREIVDYMVTESLVNYLKSKTTSTETNIRNLFSEDENTSDIKNQDDLIEALHQLKTLDPACGSGAYPMGVLQKMIHALQKLDPNGRKWIDKKVNQIPDAGLRNMVRKKFESENFDFSRKMGVIQNSIFGVDIQPVATEIARLRCFLTIIVEERIDDTAPNRGIDPLPNLDFKFVTANSLISLEEKSMSVLDFGVTDKLQDELIDIRTQFLQAYGNDKVILKDNFKAIQSRIYKKSIDSGQNQRAMQLASWKPFENECADWFDSEWMFGVDGFDIVIGNPPYGVFQGEKKKELIPIMKNKIYDKAKGGKVNAYELFLCKTPTLLKENGINCQIFQNSFLADNSSAGVRKFYLLKQEIITIDSFPERDNPKKRVFERVKMSVCILLNKNVSKCTYDFKVNFWNDKVKSSGKNMIYNNKSIIKFSDQAVIYNLNNSERVIFEKYFIGNKNKYSEYYKCFEGELNMTFHKSYLINDNTAPLVVKGAQVQRYFVTDNPSQGAVEYVDEKRYLIDNVNSDKSRHHIQVRIAMQGITGANDNIRLVATLVDKDVFLANSCNYIITTTNDNNYSIEFLLGIFNSKFTNWIFRRGSTNSNVNCYEVNNLKLPKLNKSIFNEIENHVLYLTNNYPSVDSERKIDLMVYKLYDLSYNEVKLVDPAFAMTETKYNSLNY